MTAETKYKIKNNSHALGGHGRFVGDKPDDFRSGMKALGPVFADHKLGLILASVFTIVSTILSLLGPNLLSEMTDAISAGLSQATNFTVDLDKVFQIGVLLACFYAFGFLLWAISNMILANVTQRVAQKLRSQLIEKINRITFGYLNTTTIGNIMSRVSNDVDTISQSLNQSIGTLISAIIMLLGSLVMMFITNVPLALTAVLSSLLGFVLMFAIMKRSQKYFSKQQNDLGAVNGFIEEMFSGHTIVKAYNAESRAVDKFDSLNNSLVNSGTKAALFSSLMQPIMLFIGNFGYAAICIVGGAMAMSGAIGFGTIVAFMLYVRYFTQPLGQIAQAAQAMQSAAAAGERIDGFMGAEEFSSKSGEIDKIDHVDGSVDFCHVKFGYDKQNPVINDFSASAKSGEKIAIVGPTGAGKTTLVNLLMRFYDIDAGDIKIDGTSILKMKRDLVHEQFCMVLQDSWLFDGTIKENLLYCTDVDDENVMIEACKAVGIDHFIRTLRQGYDTHLNSSVSLSQGQRQQLTIARAMISNRPMLILDEATSSVDTRTEEIIQNAMDMLMKGKTSFVIAHRLSTIKNADKILVVNHGDIIESGTHEELLEKGGFYANLYNSQFDRN